MTETSTIKEVQALVLDCATALDTARVKVRDLERRQILARQATAKAHAKFLLNHPILTPSQAAHQFAAASQQDRAERAAAQADYEARRVAAGVPRSFPIDHVGGRDESAEGAARQGFGWRGGHRRGAYPSSMKGRMVEPPVIKE